MIRSKDFKPPNETKIQSGTTENNLFPGEQEIPLGVVDLHLKPVVLLPHQLLLLLHQPCQLVPVQLLVLALEPTGVQNNLQNLVLRSGGAG